MSIDPSQGRNEVQGGNRPPPTTQNNQTDVSAGLISKTLNKLGSIFRSAARMIRNFSLKKRKVTQDKSQSDDKTSQAATRALETKKSIPVTQKQEWQSTSPESEETKQEEIGTHRKQETATQDAPVENPNDDVSTKTNAHQATFDNLPNEIIQEIFKSVPEEDLKNARLVNERFKDNIDDLKFSKINTLKFINRDLNTSDITSIMNFLKERPNVTELTLENCKITGDEDWVQLIADNLEHTSLTTLDLMSPNIKNEGAKKLANAIKSNRTLENLSLKACGIEAEGAKALGDALKENKTLKKLDLSSNFILNAGDDKINSELAGVKALSEALKENNTLKTLNLLQITQSMSNQGLHGMAATVSSHRESAGRASGQVMELLKEALSENNTLTEINLQMNSIRTKDDETYEHIQKRLKENRRGETST
jgi:hypothetical protein